VSVSLFERFFGRGEREVSLLSDAWDFASLMLDIALVSGARRRDAVRRDNVPGCGAAGGRSDSSRRDHAHDVIELARARLHLKSHYLRGRNDADKYTPAGRTPA
jgi:hypothetical protein